MMLLRLIFMISCGHYVDDLNGEEPDGSAQSAFDTVPEFTALLRWPMQPAKALPPATRLVRLGTDWSADDTALTIGPKEGITEALREVIDGHLESET